MAANKPPLFLPGSQAPNVDHVSIPYSLHRLKCIPSARERRAELLPAMRTGTAGGVGWGSSPKGPPDLPSLFICRNGLLGAPPHKGGDQASPRGQPDPTGCPQRSPQSEGGWLLTLAPSSPDVARHGQAGKKETSANQHGGQDLQDGKGQEGGEQGTFHHIKPHLHEFFHPGIPIPHVVTTWAFLWPWELKHVAVIFLFIIIYFLFIYLLIILGQECLFSLAVPI